MVLLTVAACLVYLNALGNGFALDDTAIIRDNPNIRDLSDWQSIWLKPYWPYFGVELGLWRPLILFAYAVQWAAGGGSPLLFHAVSIALHAVVTVLTFLLIRRLTNGTAALAGALLFAAHPVHTEAVANIVGQAELVTAALLVGACLVHATRPPGLAVSWPRRAALTVLFALAVLTKEHAVVLPGLLLAVDVSQQRVRLTRRGAVDYLTAMLMPLLLLACALGAYLIVRLSVLEGSLTGAEAGPQYAYLQGEYRVLNALRAFPEFLRLLVFPFDLSADYAPAMVLPVESVTLMTGIGAVLLAATVILAALTPIRPGAGFSAAWFLVTIITVSNLLFPIGVFIAERTLYLPSVAFSAAVAYGWAAVQRSGSSAARRVLPLLLGLTAIVFAGRTWLRNPDWKDTQTVLYSVLRDHPESYKAQWTQATWEWQLGRPEVAREHFELATRLYSHDSQLLSEYANFLMTYGELDRAIEMLETAFRMHPYVPRTVLLLGTAYVQAGRFEDALDVTRRADRHAVLPSGTMPIRAAAYEGLGRTDPAVGAWRYVIRHSVLPSPLGWAWVARSLAQYGYPDDASHALQRGRHAAADDSAAVGMLLEMEAAVHAGCFRDGPAASPPCDPLRGRTDPGGALQSAIQLQNATSQVGIDEG